MLTINITPVSNSFSSSACSSTACEQEVRELKSQLLEAWKQRLELHQENQRLQTCLDLREQSIRSLRRKNKRLQSLVTSPFKDPANAPDQPKEQTFERYKFEEKGQASTTSFSLNLQPVFFSEQEPTTDPDEYANISKSIITFLFSTMAQKASSKSKNEMEIISDSGISQTRDQLAEPFVMEISDLEDTPRSPPQWRRRQQKPGSQSISQSGKVDPRKQGYTAQRLARKQKQHTKYNTEAAKLTNKRGHRATEDVQLTKGEVRSGKRRKMKIA